MQRGTIEEITNIIIDAHLPLLFRANQRRLNRNTIQTMKTADPTKVADLPLEIVNEFVAGLRGTAVRPGDRDYDSARAVWNGWIDKRPGLTVRCSGVADVIHCVNFGREKNLLLAVRGGSHGVDGPAVCNDGLVIDLSLMRGVRIDPEQRTANCQGGALQGDLDHEAEAFGLAVTGGQISTTGVGGLTLGGGLGWLMRHHGLAIDHLLSVDIVTADGQLRKASATENPDLYWAVRGGGGNFGIVTNFEFNLFPLGTILAGSTLYPIEKAKEILVYYQKLCEQAPDELSLMALFLPAPPQPFIPEELHYKPIVAIGVCYSGSLEEGERVLAPLRGFESPTADLIRPMHYTTLQKMFDEGSKAGIKEHLRSEYLHNLDEAAIDLILEHVAKLNSDHSQVLLTGMGGAMARIPEGETAFHNRNAPHVIEILAKWVGAEDPAPYVEWAEEFWQALRPMSAGVYINFMGDEGEDRVRQAYGEKIYARLADLKQKYDPHNLFRMNRNIKPNSS